MSPNAMPKQEVGDAGSKPQALDMSASLVWLLLIEDKKAVELLDRLSEPETRQEFLANVICTLEHGRQNFDRLIELVRGLRAAGSPDAQ